MQVRCLDIVPPPPNAWLDPRIEYIVGDVCDEETVDRLVTGADCVWHNAAAVGPFHPKKLYFKVRASVLVHQSWQRGCTPISALLPLLWPLLSSF